MNGTSSGENIHGVKSLSVNTRSVTKHSIKTHDLGDAHIDFEPHAHVYRHREKGLAVPGVTTILNGAIPKPALIQWAANCAVQHMQDGYLRACETGSPLEQTGFLALCQDARKAHRRVTETAANRGTDVHAFAERALVDRKVTLPTDPLTKASCTAFLDWLHTAEIEPADAERIVFSKTWWYCGTADFWGRVNGRPSVLDFKSGAGFYDEHALQLAAYAVALEEELGERIEDGWIVHLDKKTGKPKLYPVPLTRGLKDNWLRVREAFEAIQKTRGLVKEIKDGARQQAA